MLLDIFLVYKIDVIKMRLCIIASIAPTVIRVMSQLVGMHD